MHVNYSFYYNPEVEVLVPVLLGIGWIEYYSGKVFIIQGIYAFISLFGKMQLTIVKIGTEFGPIFGKF